MLKTVQFNNAGEIELDFLEEELKKIKTKNEFSAAKNGLKQLKLVFADLNIPTEEYFKSVSINKRNWTKKPKKILCLDEIKRKINGLRNEKFKYAFRLMVASGLRVAEAASLTKADIKIDGDKIYITVLHGKGGSNGTVECMPDKYLAERLELYMEDKTESEQLFYSAKSMKNKAGELGLECHDLRRIAAVMYRKAHIKEDGAYAANNGTREFLRHERFATTKRYLFSRKLVVKNGKDAPKEAAAASQQLFKKVQRAMASPDVDLRLEGEVAKFVSNDLVSFRKKINSPAGRIGEIDVETNKYIIEVFNGVKAKSPKDFRKYFDDDAEYMNPGRKQVILFAPNIAETKISAIENAGVKVVRSFEELKILMEAG